MPNSKLALKSPQYPDSYSLTYKSSYRLSWYNGIPGHNKNFDALNRYMHIYIYVNWIMCLKWRRVDDDITMQTTNNTKWFFVVYLFLEVMSRNIRNEK